jgi:hypothetical protein
MPKVLQMFAFVTTDKDEDDEGVVGQQSGTTGWMPLVGADMARVESLEPIAQAIADMHGQPIRLLHWSGPPTTLRVFEPRA